MSSVLSQDYYSKVNLTAHGKVQHLVPKEWLIAAPLAFNLVDGLATSLATNAKQKGFSILPAENEVFAAFKECLPSSTKIVFIGEKPMIGGNGKCFDMPVGTKLPVSLRNIVNDIYKDTGRKSLALSNMGTYLRHLPKQGVLLLNYSLTRYEENEMPHRKYWTGFTVQLIKEMQRLRNVTFVVTSSSIDIERYISKHNRLINYFPGQGSNGLFSELVEKYRIIF